MTEIRFITCGDPHIYGGINGSNGLKLQKVIGLANQAYDQGKLDFISFLGDIADTVDDTYTKEQDAATIINGLNSNLTRYKIAGNHDVIGSQCIQTCSSTSFPIVDKSCIFKTYQSVYPEQFYTFQKDNTKYNIIIPGICAADWNVNPTWYFDFNNSNINKSLPTLVFNHGPIYKFDNWSSFDMYAQGMSSKLDEFSNLIGIYAGHIHEDSDNTTDNTRQITNNALSNTNNVGYTRIVKINDNNTTDYTMINYTQSFQDPFPDDVCPLSIQFGIN